MKPEKSAEWYWGRMAVLDRQITSRIDDAHNEHAKDCIACDYNEAMFNMASATLFLMRGEGRKIIATVADGDHHYHLPDESKETTRSISGGLSFTCKHCEQEVIVHQNSFKGD